VYHQAFFGASKLAISALQSRRPNLALSASMANLLPWETLVTTLDSLQLPLLALKRALSTSTSAPPRQIYIHAPFSPSVTSLVLHALLDASENESAFPSAAFIDCMISYSPRLIYDSVLNALAGWTPEWDDSLDGAPNWDGRTQSFNLVEDASGKKRVRWNKRLPIIVPKGRNALTGHANDSLGAFLDGLKALYTLETEAIHPKFIVFCNAEQLLPMTHAPAAATASSARETGTQDGAFMAALSRLGELVCSAISSWPALTAESRPTGLSCLYLCRS
jgi:hypothetical protein